MKRLSLAIVLCVLLWPLSSVASVKWTALEHPDFVGMSPGPDKLWGTADDLDVSGMDGGNPRGSSMLWQPLDDSFTAYISSVITTTGPIPAGAGTLELTANTSDSEILGIAGGGGTAPTDFTKSNTWTLGGSNDVVFDMFFVGGLKLVGTGNIFYTGQKAEDVAGLFGDPGHINYMLDRIVGDYDAAIFFSVTFEETPNVPSALGTVNGLYVGTTVVPVPPAILLLSTGLAGLLVRTRKQQ